MILGVEEMDIMVKRVYEDSSPDDGIRILVDRLWPRGISKEKARVDYWARTISPSNELRKWYGHDPAKWEEFKKKYYAELDGSTGDMKFLLEKIRKGRVTFLYSSTEKLLNNAQALKLYLGLPIDNHNSTGRVGSMFDYHKDRQPGEILEISLADFFQREGERQYGNLWFFTRC